MAKKPTKAQLEQAAAMKIREAVDRLIRIRHPDWDDYEWDWLYTQVRRPPDYVFSVNQQAYLDRLVFNSKSFREYAGYTVPELIAIAYPMLRSE